MHLFNTVFSGKKHTSKETTDICRIFDLGELREPVDDQLVCVEDCGIVLWKIRLACGYTPFVSSLIRLHLTGKDLKEGCFGKLVAAYESNLVIVSDNERDVVENLSAVDRLADSVYG